MDNASESPAQTALNIVVSLASETPDTQPRDLSAPYRARRCVNTAWLWRS